MTNQGGEASGSSLFQARSTRHDDNHELNHNHNHLHQHQHQHHHLHPHQRRRLLHHVEADSASPHIRSPSDEKTLHNREAVVIVQTVSVINYIDASGVVTSVETVRSPDPVPVAQTTLDLPAVVTAGLSVLGNLVPSVSLSGLLPGPSDGAPSATSSVQSETASSSLSASSMTLTSAPLSSSTNFVALWQPNVATFLELHTDFVLSFHLRFYYDREQQFSVDFYNGLTPETRNAVVGGVVGSVAGLALIALIFLYLLKWKKQRGQGIMLLGDSNSSARGGGVSSPDPAMPRSGTGMAERSGPFAIPSALAKLTGGRRAIDAPPGPPVQEKGFYRVSGRKLISVLESGGDGYTDPHDSVGSATSYYRDSQSFVDGSKRPPLQLGSPMRPVSGVPIFRDGPQRTPVHEEGPRPGGPQSSASPGSLPLADAPGRSFASRDSPRGSGSRFTEHA
ncbi:8cb567b0-8546-4533-a25f-42271a8511d6 [Thermothielavioides terrestris]|uniref:8cb567b0-8546-4533-a25f-42271a8511d6 n=1 Tax=Thermothielavioides terrestris TaxID=2587410 RepID=A0A446BGZ0_9PEZI|nr:8cb567b0-8546-4533-a25f-42271a8511d6 [Thermothielavioides terrestris]